MVPPVNSDRSFGTGNGFVITDMSEESNSPGSALHPKGVEFDGFISKMTSGMQKCLLYSITDVRPRIIVCGRSRASGIPTVRLQRVQRASRNLLLDSEGSRQGIVR